MDRRPSVTAVVLNWCGEEVSRACLRSLLESSYPNLTILLVDNGSKDGSGERLRDAFPEVAYLQTGRNLGFTGGNNRGIAWALDAGTDYVLVLNNDTVVDPRMVDALVDTAEAPAEGRVGGVAPKILYHDHPDRIWYAGGHFSPLHGCGVHWREGELDGGAESEDVAAISFMTGCCCLLPSEALREVGGFTEELFAYGEDADLSLRLLEAGYRLVYQPRARLLHHSPPPGASPTPFQIRQRDVNRRWVMRAHYSAWRRIPFLARFYLTRVVLAAGYAMAADGKRLAALWDGAFGRVGVVPE